MDFPVEFMWIFVVCILPSLWNRTLPSIHISLLFYPPCTTKCLSFFVRERNLEIYFSDQTQSTSNPFRSMLQTHFLDLNFGETLLTVCLMFLMTKMYNSFFPCTKDVFCLQNKNLILGMSNICQIYWKYLSPH